MSWMTIGAGLFGAWVLLLILSGERRHRMEVVARESAIAARQAAEIQAAQAAADRNS